MKKGAKRSSSSSSSSIVPGNSGHMDVTFGAKRNSRFMGERVDGGVFSGNNNTLNGKKRHYGSYNSHVPNASINSSSTSTYNSNRYDHVSTGEPNAFIQQHHPNYHQTNMMNGSSSINNSISMNHHNNYMQSFPTSTLYSAYSNPTSGLPMLYNPIMNASLYPSSMSNIPVSSATQPPLPLGPPPSNHHHQQHHQQQQPMKSSSCPTPQYKYKSLFYKKS
jgi:hypothetical protein